MTGISTAKARGWAAFERARSSKLAKWPGVLLPLLAIAVVVTATVLLPAQADEPDEQRAAAPVEVVRLSAEESMITSASYIGRVEARRRSDLGFELGGELASVVVDDGEAFRRGQVLARLDTARLQARRRELTMQASRAAADARQARSLFERNEALKAEMPEAVADQTLDDVRFTLAAADAQVAATQAQIDAVEVDLARARLVAPYAGQVLERQMDEGQIASPGAPVLTIVETAAPEARIGIPSSRQADFDVGTRMMVLVDGENVPGRVRSISPARSEQTRTVDVILTLAAPLGRVRDGDLAQIALEQRISGEGFWVPLTAITESRRGLWSVYVVERQKGDRTPVLARREVELIGQTQSRAFVRGAVVANDLVVATGIQRLAPGAPVRVARIREVAR